MCLHECRRKVIKALYDPSQYNSVMYSGVSLAAQTSRASSMPPRFTIRTVAADDRLRRLPMGHQAIVVWVIPGIVQVPADKVTAWLVAFDVRMVGGVVQDREAFVLIRVAAHVVSKQLQCLL